MQCGRYRTAHPPTRRNPRAAQKPVSIKSCKRSRSRCKRPVMTQPPVRQQNRLGTLQMCVPGHERLAGQLRLFDQCRLQIFQCRIKSRNSFQHPQSKIGGDLVVAAAPRVEFACRIANQFSQAAFDSGVNVFVGGREGKPSRRKFFSDGRKPKARWTRALSR